MWRNDFLVLKNHKFNINSSSRIRHAENNSEKQYYWCSKSDQINMWRFCFFANFGLKSMNWGPYNDIVKFRNRCLVVRMIYRGKVLFLTVFYVSNVGNRGIEFICWLVWSYYLFTIEVDRDILEDLKSLFQRLCTESIISTLIKMFFDPVAPDERFLHLLIIG